jgi:DNA-binding GntR family transcriptional regulator
MKLALKQSATQDYLSLAERFHDTLVSQCGNRLLKKLYDQIRLNIRRYQSVMAQLPGSPKQSIKEHEQIVAAIRAGDSDTASAHASAHITALVNRFEEHRQKISKIKPVIKL